MKKAIITGITGQDGGYLAKLLLDKGYKVYGAQRRNTGKRYWRLDELGIRDDIEIVDIDLTEVNAQPDFGSDGDSFTAGFELLDLSISRSFSVEGVEDFKVVLFANNLLDEIARNHSSTVKNEVPLPGKNLGIGFRVTL